MKVRTAFTRNQTRRLGFPTRFLALFLLVSATPLLAQKEWWNEEWQSRLKLSIDPTAEGVSLAGDPGTVPVLVRLHGGNYPFGEAAPDGSDIRFVSGDNETVYDYHIERLDPLLQEGFVWVEIPAVMASEAQDLWLYYGKMGPASRGEDASKVYGDENVLTFHFSETGAAPADASGRGNHADRAGISVQGGLIAGALRLTGRDGPTVAESPSLAVPAGGPLTVSVWAAPSAVVPDGAIVSRLAAGAGFELGMHNGLPYVEIISGGSTQRVEAPASVAPGTWTHLAFVGDASGTTLYVNGKPSGTLAAPIPAMGGAVRIGTQADGSPGFQGEIDVLQISLAARPQGFLEFSAINQGADPAAQALLTLTFDDSGAKGWLEGDHYMLAALRTLDASGWAVMIALGMMSAWSWIVMVSKIIALNRITGLNKRFVKMWQSVSNDLTVLDNPDQIETMGGQVEKKETDRLTYAPVYKLYHTGVAEIRNRFDGSLTAYRRLSGASLQAIRSAMMSTYIRQTQRLNKRVVHLQIAVAGGPFLGLFGTVLGVTVTFAVIAQSGEVNVASIAPGVSGALLTTVAGLLVAIPALFGYNFIVGQIKDVINDMRVFTDEFITKSAEFYSQRKEEGEGAIDGMGVNVSPPIDAPGTSAISPERSGDAPSAASASH